MQIEDIKKQTWKVSDQLKVIEYRYGNLSNNEQECHINIVRMGYDNEEEEEIIIDCSYQSYINTLSKSEYFTVKKVTISTHTSNKGFIVNVCGTLSNDGLTIRKKRAVFSEEQKKERSDRLKQIMQRKKEQITTI